jgi:hypothetical protein
MVPGLCSSLFAVHILVRFVLISELEGLTLYVTRAGLQLNLFLFIYRQLFFSSNFVKVTLSIKLVWCFQKECALD